MWTMLSGKECPPLDNGMYTWDHNHHTCGIIEHRQPHQCMLLLLNMSFTITTYQAIRAVIAAHMPCCVAATINGGMYCCSGHCVRTNITSFVPSSMSWSQITQVNSVFGWHWVCGNGACKRTPQQLSVSRQAMNCEICSAC